MRYVKLQFGCLLVILYIVITYIRAIKRRRSKTSRQYNLLTLVAPIAVIFDGITAWTVNHMDIVPSVGNRLVHLLFFLFMDFTIIITSRYMYDLLIGYDKTAKWKKVLLNLPGMISVLLTTVGIGELHYIKGATTWYSMGFSVYICYGTLVLYYGAILYIVASRRRFLESGKILETLTCIGIAGVILAIQICFPEVLLTAIFPTILLLGIYIGSENPSIRQLEMRSDEMLDGFATLVENKDSSTGGHIKRTRAYVNLILGEMKDDRHYRDVMCKDYMENVSNAAPLHDIGKIATPDSILQKPGKLTDDEYKIMKEHAAEGGKIILQIFYNMDDAKFRQIAYEIARFHHEKYNGRGYPDGLVGEQIPLHARIMAIADVFDAVSQKRCYREAMTIEDSFSIIEKGIGTDFDPHLAQIFLDNKDEVIKLMKQFQE